MKFLRGILYSISWKAISCDHTDTSIINTYVYKHPRQRRRVPILCLLHSFWARFEWNMRSSVQSYTPPDFLNIVSVPPGWLFIYGVASYIVSPTSIHAESAWLCLRSWHIVYVLVCCLLPTSKSPCFCLLCIVLSFFWHDMQESTLLQVSRQ